MSALEEAGCERIVVESGNIANPEMFKSLARGLSPGDCVVVLNLLAVASSLSEFVGLAAELGSRDIRLRALSEEFDTHGPHSDAIRSLLWQLLRFEQQIE